MKKALLTFVAVLATTALVIAQDSSLMVCSFNCTADYKTLIENCLSTTVRPVIKAPNVNPYTEFDAIIRQIKLTNGNPYPLVYRFSACTEVCNASSMLDKENNQVIYYNQSFLNEIRGENASRMWAIRSIIAHEIGHHIYNHTDSKDSLIDNAVRRQMERRADFFSGYVISLFSDATVENALEGLQLLNNTDYFPADAAQEEGAPYPIMVNRMEAVTDGFNQARAGDMKIAFFAQIDSIARVLSKKYRRSQILRVLDQEISMGDFQAAKQYIEQYLTDPESKINQDFLLKYRSELEQKYQEYQKSESPIRPVKKLEPTSAAVLREIIQESERIKASPPEIKKLKKELKNIERSGVDVDLR
ncbi:hypothetical protein LZZ85_13200 [Terrimonas sp. NA20]|uniref:Peptidase M48 domain-containing protein n=1 Tax=Terrimonas ginsenosidimutans TaxID=2908004 RepID=A0ABS9KSF8_9BACT|nr:hypothetical protein [Terrimonas ginsenosidimutans]MCG2615251.1 hypothetical protein [Terrimonas ginsenosidimutans]